MNFSTFVVMAILFGIMLVSVIGYWKRRKQNANNGCGSCSSCPMAGRCNTKK